MERAKLAALREAGIPAATKCDPAPIERRTAQAASAEAGARGRTLQLDREATSARDRWRGLVERCEARARGLQGTG